MSLRELRPETSPDEHAYAIHAATLRLGRELTAAETRMDIVGQDRDLKNGKQLLHEAVLAEQARAVEEYVTHGTPIHLHVTDAMLQVLADLYDAGTAHAAAELQAVGVTTT